MTTVPITTAAQPIIEIVGGDVPSDELLELLAEWLLDLVDDGDDDE